MKLRHKPLLVGANGATLVSGRSAPKVALGYASGGQVHVPFMESLLRLQQYEYEVARAQALVRYRLPQQGFFIEDNRNEIARRFLETDADWLLMIDSDISFPPQLVEMLMLVAGQDKRAIGVSVPLGLSGELGRPLPSCGLRMTDQPGVWTYLEPDEITAEGVEVHGLAMPVFLAHREVYEAIAAREGQAWFFRRQVPRLNDERSRRAWLETDGRPADRQYINEGEDLSFCLRATEAGIRLWCCRLPGLRHHKTALPLSHDDVVDAPAPAEREQEAVAR